MAVQHGLITTYEDFKKHETLNTKFIPPFYNADGEGIPEGAITVGTPEIVEGIRGKAYKFNRNSFIRWNAQAVPTTTEKFVSFWFKPTPADVSTAGANWRILFTNRGSGYGDYGFHIALYNGFLNARAIGNNGQLNLYSDGTAGFTSFVAEADKWYHVAMMYERRPGYAFSVFVDGVRVISSAIDPNVLAHTRSISLGDMPSGNSVSTNAYAGIIDEFYYMTDALWYQDKIQEYVDDVKNGRYVDWFTEKGSILLPKITRTIEVEQEIPPTEEGGAPTYEIVPVEQEVYTDAVLTWESEVLDLGNPFDGFGRVQLNFDRPSRTRLTVFTATSDDGVTFSEYEDIRQDGFILSPNRRYMKIKVLLSTSDITVTPRLDEVQILGYATTERLPLNNAPLKIYRDLATGLEYAGEFKNAYDIVIDEEVNGEDLLTFKVPMNDARRKELGVDPIELIVEVADRMYIIREAIDERTGGKSVTTFKAESRAYELRDHKVMSLNLETVTAFDAINAVLNSAMPATDWKLSQVGLPSTHRRSLTLEWKSVLGALNDIVATWGGELVFDTANKEIALYGEYGSDNGIRFYYNKNLKSVVRTVDTYDLVTRIYPQGKGDLDISTVNNGVPYIEDLTWVNALNLRNKVRLGRWKDERYIYPENLKEDALKMLQESSRPRVGYVITVQDLSALSGHEHEAFNLGDYVYTVDNDLMGTEIRSRIVRRQYNVREPWKTVVELSQPKKQLSDALRQSIDDRMEYLQTADLMDTNDVKQMTVFNYLLNSRADMGINADWQKVGTGFEIANEGHSGEWSFKATGGYGRSSKLTQRVYGLSHRNAYTISASVATEGAITRGSTPGLESFVGMKVILTYTDGTKEEHLLAFEDVVVQDEEQE